VTKYVTTKNNQIKNHPVFKISCMQLWIVKILMGDFNAHIGSATTSFESVIGNEVLGVCTDNGERLLSLCSNSPKTGGSIFMHKKIHKGMNQSDHICISRRQCTALQDVRAHRGTSAYLNRRCAGSKV